MATANTFVQIGSTVTVGGAGAASIDFTSIPATYTDLVLKISWRGAGTGANMSIGLRINSSASDSSYINVGGDGTSTFGGNNSSNTNMYIGELNNGGSTSNVFSNVEVYIPNYAGSNQKSISTDAVSEANGTTAYAMLLAGLCTKTAAVTTLTISPWNGAGDNVGQYSTASLYGILKY